MDRRPLFQALLAISLILLYYITETGFLVVFADMTKIPSKQSRLSLIFTLMGFPPLLQI